MVHGKIQMRYNYPVLKTFHQIIQTIHHLLLEQMLELSNLIVYLQLQPF